MKKIRLIAAALIFALAPIAEAQNVQPSAKQMIQRDITRVAAVYHCYEAMDTTDTPAPKGYEPFYISHIGRHGSRYRDDVAAIESCIGKINDYASQMGGLTEDGQKMADFLQGLLECTTGNEGKLTSIGAAEHRQIASRMLRRFPTVFSNPDRNRLLVYSTSSKRVMESRDNFLSMLPSGFEIQEFVKNDKYKEISASDRVTGRKLTPEEKATYEELRNKKYTVADNPDAVSMERLVKKTFVCAAGYDEEKMFKFFSDLMKMVLSRQCLECDLPYPYDYFTADEAYTFWWKSNCSNFNWICLSTKTQGIRTKAIGCNILKHMIEDADDAIGLSDKQRRQNPAGNGVAADLRFSHDVYVMPFISIIACEGNEFCGDPGDAPLHWMNFNSLMMGMNYQFIFYTNRQGRVLVKMLLNEREVTIPALPTSKAPYYDWHDLRAYLMQRAQE